jgi:hypothetical protein
MGSFPYVIRVFVVRRLTARRECFFSFSHLLAASVMVSRSAAAFSLPLPPTASAPLRQIAPSRHRRTFRQSRGATVGSGLRLCVKDGLLQVYVLLATQGDNSRIRWSVLQECQHVLSSDIKPYNKKLLGTSSVSTFELRSRIAF